MKMSYFFERIALFEEYVLYRSMGASESLLMLFALMFVAALTMLFIGGKTLKECSTYFIAMGAGVAGLAAVLCAFRMDNFFLALLP